MIYPIHWTCLRNKILWHKMLAVLLLCVPQTVSPLRAEETPIDWASEVHSFDDDGFGGNRYNNFNGNNFNDAYYAGHMARVLQAITANTSDLGRKSLADKHAPAGIMADHLHKPGEIMAEYKYMTMVMDGNRFGTTNLTDQQAFTVGQALVPPTNNAITPTHMTMEMHMAHLMYGWKENITLYTMLTFPSLTMDHLRSPTFPIIPLRNTPFTTHNSGIGDTVFGALWQIHETPDEQVILNLAFSIPTGGISRNTAIPTGGMVEQRLPYPMQLGSGSFDLMPGISYRKFFPRSSIGAQFQTDLPVGRNRLNYRVGEQYRLSAWYAYLKRDWLSFTFRAEGVWEENYHGADPALVAAEPLISTARPDMRGGEWVNFGYGFQALMRNSHLINCEITHPVYQNLDGIQLKSTWNLFVSWSKGW